MVQEAEKFKEDDTLQQKKIESKNQLESLLHTAKSSIDGENKSKLEAEEIEVIGNTVKETEEWLLNDDLTKDDYQNKLTELNGLINPIMSTLHGGQGPMETPSETSMPGVSIDEID